MSRQVNRENTAGARDVRDPEQSMVRLDDGDPLCAVVLGWRSRAIAKAGPSGPCGRPGGSVWSVKLVAIEAFNKLSSLAQTCDLALQVGAPAISGHNPMR